MSFCKDCFTGVRHEGTPTGILETIGGVRSYVATPTTDYPKDTVILFLLDLFGLELNNNLLLMDDLARNGFKVVGPDYLNGDPISIDAEHALSTGTFDLSTWFANHTTERTRALLNAVIAALKAEGVTKFGAVGYCFGGRYVFDLAFDNVTQASVVNHPSLLQVPEDIQRYKDTAKAPLLINSCPMDMAYPPEKQALGDEILGGGKFSPGYERKHWDGCAHGFAVRGDLSNPYVKAGKEGAFKAAVEWFFKYL
ncbi:hypothetical protein PLICRDRAFT_256519 [Plicaturopsis crispa FD-325 SS-3]|nr:hypothetical protein PLICRDRAFT_256519 [Plicaturopsis crispa FD-325 SS-3]